MSRHPLRSLRSATVAVGVAGALSVSVPVLLAAFWQSPSTVWPFHHPQPPRNPVAHDCDRYPLAPNPTLRPGECVMITARGFEPQQQVKVGELIRPGVWQVTRADRDGVVSYQLSLPKKAATGKDVITFVGLGAVPNRSAAKGNVTVSVPRFAVFRFTVRAR
jgi:hypothetical protein